MKRFTIMRKLDVFCHYIQNILNNEAAATSTPTEQYAKILTHKMSSQQQEFDAEESQSDNEASCMSPLLQLNSDRQLSLYELVDLYSHKMETSRRANSKLSNSGCDSICGKKGTTRRQLAALADNSFPMHVWGIFLRLTIYCNFQKSTKRMIHLRRKVAALKKKLSIPNWLIATLGKKFTILTVGWTHVVCNLSH